MSTTKEIKNQLTDETIYPITKANAVYMTNSSKTVEAVINNDLVHTAGSTMSGLLYMDSAEIWAKEPAIDTGIQPVTTYYGGIGFTVKDPNNETISYLSTMAHPTLGIGAQIGGHRKIGDNHYYNTIWLNIKEDGSKYVDIDKDAWLSALALTGTDHLFKVKNYSISNGSMTAGSTKVHTATDLGKTNPTGYTPISYYYLTTGNNSINAYVVNIGATGSANLVYLKNLGTSTISASTFSISIVYAKSDFITTV